MRHLYIACLFCLCSCGAFQSISSTAPISPTVVTNPQTNDTPQTQAKPITGEAKALDKGDSLAILVLLDIPRITQESNALELFMQDFTVQYGVLPAYNSPQYSETAVITPKPSMLRLAGEQLLLTFSAPKREGQNAVMILEVIDRKSGEKLKIDMLLPYITLKMRERFTLFDKAGIVPCFTNYLQTRDTLQIRDLKGTSQIFYVKYYKQTFDPASPPMTTGDKLPAKTSKPDTVFTIRSNEPIQFKQAGLYFIQNDSAQYYGLGVQAVERKYPKLSYIKDVVEPLRYLTTDEEFFQLRNSADIKTEMDKFWLKLMNNNVALAQKTIREYYNRVRLANRYFTSYKEGWKTDMGMIFIIYGRPSRIIRTNEMEFWFYNPNVTNPTEIRFSFAKKPNQYLDDAYTLVRQGVYESVWYPAIELWRSGKAF